MRLFSVVLLGLVFGLMPFTASAADAARPLSDAEKAQIEDVIRTYLTKKEPMVVLKAMQEVQKLQEEENNNKSKQGINLNRDKLFNDPATPFIGNPKGDVTMVEFFDYQCGYCKLVTENLLKIIGEDKNVRIVLKDYPILGPASTTAAKASLASVRQGKFDKFHFALLKTKERLSDEVIFQVAKDVGLNVDKLRKDMEDPAIAKQIESDLELGNEIGVRGTPMFVIGDKTFPGAIQYSQMKQAIDAARKK